MFGMGSGNQMEVVIDGDASGLQSALTSAQSSVGGFQKAVAGAGVAAAAGIGAGMAKSVQAAAGFDEAMQESIAIMGDVDAAMREDLEQSARDVATSTTKSHEDAAESFYFLASAGMDAEQSIAAMPEVAAYAEAGAMDMANATDYATDTAKAFGIEAENLNRVTDTMTATFTNHNQTAEGMGQAMSMVAPIASGLGVEIEETAAAIGMMGDAGIKGSKAGRTLRQAFKRLTDPPAKVSDKLDELGVAVTDSNGDMRSMEDIMGDLEAAGADTSDMMQIFGARAGPGMQVLLQEGADQLGENTERIKEMDGATQDIAETQKQTFNKQLGILKSNITDVGVAIGSALLPPLTTLVQKITPLVQRFSDWVSSGNEVKVAVAAIGTALAALLPAVSLLVGYLGGVTGILSAVAGGFAMLLSPMWLVVGAVAAVATAFSSNFAGVRDAVLRVVGVLRDEFGKTVELLSSMVGPAVGDVSQAFSDFASTVEAKLRPVVSFLADKLVAGIRLVGETTRDAIQTASDIWNRHKDTVSQAIDRIKQALEPVIDAVQSFAEKLGFLDEKGRPTGKTLVKVGMAILGLSNPITMAIGLVTILGQLWEDNFLGIRDVTMRVLGKIEGVVTEKLDLLEQKWREWGPKVKQAVDTALQGVKEFIDKFLGQVEESWQRSGDQITNFVSQDWGEIKQIVRGVLEAIIGIVQPLLARIKTFWQNHGDRIMRIVVKLTELVVRLITGLFSTLMTIIKPALDLIAAAWDRWGNEIIAIVEFAFDLIVSAIGWALETIEMIIDVTLAVLEGDWAAAWDAIAGYLESTLDGIISFAKTWGGRFLDWLGQLVSDAIQWFVDLATELIGASVIPDMFNDIISEAESFGSDFLSWLSQMVSDFIADIQQWASDVISEVQTLASDWLSEFQTLVSDLLSDLSSFVSDFISDIQSWASDVISEVVSMADDFIAEVERIISECLSKIRSWDLPGAVKSIAETAYNKFKSALDLGGVVESAISSAKSKLQSFNPMNWVDSSPGGGGGGGSSSSGSSSGPDIGRGAFAHGGIVTSPTQAIIGEAGDNEAVIPLNNQGASFLRDALGGEMGGGGTHIDVTVNANGAAEGRAAGRAFTNALRSQNFD